MRPILIPCLVGLVATALAVAVASQSLSDSPKEPVMLDGLYELPLTDIDGKPTSFARYRGHPVLVVNTASLCGLTGQYAGLQKLYKDYKDRGLRIAAFPANDFRGQEPGSNADVKEFCISKYAIQFDLYEKSTVVPGPEQHPLFVKLTAASEEPSWNFTKYLIDGEGRLVRRFSPRTEPQDKDVTGAIEALLTVKPAS